jgi:hypothetical protein
MADVAATALLRGAGKASRRFMADFAVSAMATLCVTLVFSSWPRQEGSNSSVSEPAAAFAPLAAPPATEILPGTKAGAGTLSARPATGHDETIGAANHAELVPAAPAASVRDRPTRPPRATARGASRPCGTSCTSHATAAAVNLRPPTQQAVPDPRPVVLATAIETDPSRSIFGVRVPSVAMPEILLRSVRPVLQGASSVTDMMSGFARKW